MKNEMEDYKVLKVLSNLNHKNVSVIEFNKKNYLLKEITNDDEKTINMLKNEARCLEKLQSTEVVPKLYFYEFNNERNYIVMEFVEGKPINKLNIKKDETKIILMLKMIQTINLIHNENIIHCDLKPQNILLNFDKEIKIIDFGIAINDYNYFPGYCTVRYCSKDQALNKQNLDEYTDLYSLGIIFYQLMTGKTPFGKTKKEILERKRNNDYDKVNNPKLESIFNKIFTRKYSGFKELKEDIQKLL